MDKKKVRLGRHGKGVFYGVEATIPRIEQKVRDLEGEINALRGMGGLPPLEGPKLNRAQRRALGKKK